MKTTPEPTARAAAALAGLSLLVFAALKLYGFHHAVGDENIYLYLVERLSQGARLYVDLVHAHPPLHLLPLSWVASASGGVSLLLARIVPLAATMLAGLLLYRMGRRRDPLEGALACLLFLFSFDVLRVSTHFVGSNLAVMWVAIGLERLCRGRDGQAALAFCAGTFTLSTAGPAAVGAGLTLLAADPRRGLRFAAAGAGIFVLLNALAWAVWGAAFFEQVYLFHLGKSAVAGGHAAQLRSLVSYNSWLFGGAGLGVLALLLAPAGKQAPPDQEDGSPPDWRSQLAAGLSLHAPTAAAIASALFLASLSRVFPYYFEVLLLCIAPLAAHGLASMLRAIHGAIRSPGAERIALAAGLVVFFLVSRLPASNLLRDGTGERERHTWRASGLAPLDAVVRPLLWRDEGAAGLRYAAWTEYLWHEADHFEIAAAMARRIRDAGGGEETIFGDSTSAPLVALLAERRLSLDAADTNVMRFAERGKAAALIERLESDPPDWLIERDGRGLFTVAAFSLWRDAHYVEQEVFEDETRPRRYRLYRRRRD